MQLQLIPHACLGPSRCGVLLSVNVLWYSQEDDHRLHMHCSAQLGGDEVSLPIFSSYFLCELLLLAHLLVTATLLVLASHRPCRC